MALFCILDDIEKAKWVLLQEDLIILAWAIETYISCWFEKELI